MKEAAGANAGRCTPSGTGLGYEEVQRRRGTGARTCTCTSKARHAGTLPLPGRMARMSSLSIDV